MAGASIEARVVLRLAFDVGEPLKGVGANKRDYEMSSCQGDGMLYVGDQAMPVERFGVTLFKREGDRQYELFRSLQRGDRVEFAISLDERPYDLPGTPAAGGRKRQRWALQSGTVYSMRIKQRAEVGEPLEA